ncbi:MAG: hypothetical protein DRN04_10800 [Thermoprotei archaeon]|mgnify:CR=1 FL=1|nr:MAG: hypothetical protein DRN04_10800 [Thermoprotei archaeon]
MNKYWSVGILRLVIDLWKNPETHTIVDSILSNLSKKYGVEKRKAVPILAKKLEPILIEMGYEVTEGVVNNWHLISNKEA